MSKKNQPNDSHQIWDEILKAIVERMPNQLLPLIEDVFQVTYPPDVSIKILPTNRIIPKDIVTRKLTSIYSDIAIQISEDYYHIESQLTNDSKMCIRMFRYDFHLALANSIKKISSHEFSITFPKSVVIYPAANSQIPDHLTCHIHFADGSTHDYIVPTLKISDYSFHEIYQKHLTIFLPFKLLEMRPRLHSKTHPLSEKELTEFVGDIILILQNERDQHRLTEEQYEDYIELVDQAAERVFAHHEAYRNEVIRLTKSTIVLPSEKYERFQKKITKQVTEQVTQQVTEQVTQQVTQQVTEHFNNLIAAKDSEIEALKAQLAELQSKQD